MAPPGHVCATLLWAAVFLLRLGGSFAGISALENLFDTVALQQEDAADTEALLDEPLLPRMPAPEALVETSVQSERKPTMRHFLPRRATTRRSRPRDWHVGQRALPAVEASTALGMPARVIPGVGGEESAADSDRNEGADSDRNEGAAVEANSRTGDGIIRLRGAETDSVGTRPGAGGPPDLIDFGIAVKAVQIASEGSFNADIVIFMQWNDMRAAKLLPEGIEELTLSPQAAAKNLWLPDIRITNRQIRGIEVISSAITVARDGGVSKVERVNAKLINHFDLTSFPFDRQTLSVRIASGTLMANDLELRPMEDPELVGVNPSAFANTDFKMVSSSTRVYREADGFLVKSRGELRINVKRLPGSYVRKKLLPQMLLVAISWTVFYFPLLPPFAMPRVATSLIAFLALMALKSAAHGGGWTDLVWETCVILLFLTIMLNIFVEIVNHTLNQASIARRMDNELKIVLPLLAIANFVILFNFTTKSHIFWVGWCTMMISLAGPVAYIAYCFWRFHKIMDTIRSQADKHMKGGSTSSRDGSSLDPGAPVSR